MTLDDVETVSEFLQQPHVARWWRDDATVEGVAAHYGPALRGEEPTALLIAVVDDRPIGFGQWYLWDDNAEGRDAYGIPAGTVGIDYLIGHAWDCERGWGTALVSALIDAAPELPIWVTPEFANEPSCRVLEKNGFELMAVKQCHVPDEPDAGPTALYRRSPMASVTLEE
jgi:aminoglycoside 6'-N-acetyltransferase